MGLKSIVKGGVIGSMVGMGPVGSILGGVAGGAKDFLLGKKKGGFSPDEISGEIRRVQGKGILSAEQGLDRLNKALEQDSDSVVRQQVAQQQQGIVSAAQDARRRAQQLMAQRGLKNTSLGLASDRSITQSMGEQNAQLQSQIPGLIRAQRLSDAQTLQQAGLNTFGGLGGSAGVRFQGQEGTRSGGLLGIASALAPIAGTIGGMVAAGPSGGAAGSGIGSGVGSVLQPKPVAMNYQQSTGSIA